MNRGNRRDKIFKDNQDRHRFLNTLEEACEKKDSPAGRRVFRQHMERRRQEDPDKGFKPTERGWFHGGEAFKLELLAQVDIAPGPQ